LPEGDGAVPAGQQDDWLRNRAWFRAHEVLKERGDDVTPTDLVQVILANLRLDVQKCPPSGAPWGEDDLLRHARSAAEKARVQAEKVDFRRNKAGSPIQCESNVSLGLRFLQTSIRWNDFSETAALTRGGVEKNIKDVEMQTLHTDLEEYDLQLSQEKFARYISVIAYRDGNRFHPVREYLDSLRWDGKQRVDGWLTRYGHAELTPYTRAVGRIFLMAAVRRVRQPGCKYDEILTLCSPQGTGKSTMFKTLCPDSDWFHDSFSLSLDAKQIIEQASGKWIVEVSDMKGHSRKDDEHIKAVLSSSVDVSRLAYGRVTSRVQRQFIFAGTTNVERSLRDPTGNRRHWPVEVRDGIDLSALAKDRDQLWAEASQMEAEGGSIRLAPELWAEAGKAQEASTLNDPLFEILERTFDYKIPMRAVNEQLWNILGRDGEPVPPFQRAPMGHSVSAAMQKLGFKSHSFRLEGKVWRGYIRGWKEFGPWPPWSNLGPWPPGSAAREPGEEESDAAIPF
jgi:hypothetical protein